MCYNYISESKNYCEVFLIMSQNYTNLFDLSKTPDLIQLSDEQQFFVEKALEGNNILVNACIGSGKTTAIQILCDKLPKRKSILYLTYNRLLKIDAQAKIKNSNVQVQNYHGIASYCLNKLNVSVGISDLISCFNELHPPLNHYDVLIIDEYQDNDK